MQERLKALRKSLKMTQQAFAEAIGMKQNTIASYEMGRVAPSDAAINNICKTFGANELWLRTGEGEMFRKLDKMDELMEATGRFFANETNEFRLRFVSAAIHFTDAQWQALEAYCKLLFGENGGIPGNPPPADEENSSTTDAGNP